MASIAATLWGCGHQAATTVNPFAYTCAELHTDFRKPGDAPADRLQAVVDDLVSRANNQARTDKAMSEEIIYALATLCAQARQPKYTPAPAALRFAQNVEQGR